MFDYIITAVITFGLAFSFAVTDGPLGMFDKIKKQVTSRYPEGTWQNTGIGCQICCGWWIGMPVAYFMETGICGWLFAFGMLNIITSVSPE
jgi:hypothetical protein